MLLERLRPGTFLADADVDAVAVMADLLERLMIPVGAPFRRLADEATTWANSLPRAWQAAGRPCERRLVDAALALIRELDTPEESVLLHQDLHGHNVLSAAREPWLVIDPKPLRGERAFQVAPIVRSRELGHSRALVWQRLDRLCERLSLDRRRARGWTVAWGFGGRFDAQHYEVVRWLLARPL